LFDFSSFSSTDQGIRVDNGPEFTSYTFVEWAKKNEIEIQHIQPGKPLQNSYIERFNRTFRQEILGAFLFDDLNKSETWQMNGSAYTTIKDLMTL
jgi:putative transposase